MRGALNMSWETLKQQTLGKPQCKCKEDTETCFTLGLAGNQDINSFYEA
jgi:hypothetical protein